MNQDAVHVGVELGGTKIVVGSSSGGTGLLHREAIATVEPEATLTSVRASIERVLDDRHVAAIGIASFGPIDLRPRSRKFGVMLETPKPGWSGVDILAGVGNREFPAVIDTDVNAAMLAEKKWGAGTSENAAYLTVGTGIGGAVWSGGGVIHGANHSEIGHIRVPRHPDDDFSGNCRFHGDCLEGMASGTAIRDRWGVSADRLGSAEIAALKLESWYLAHAIASLGAVIPVEQVIIGGGVSKMAGFHESVAAMLPHASHRYPAVPFAAGGPQILAPALGDDAGVIGAIELGRAISTA
jgi:fructokinase